MLSHLRFHRRPPSNPASPIPDQGSSWESAHAHDNHQMAKESASQSDVRPRSSNAVSSPPTLPPIPRVTSESDLMFEVEEKDVKTTPPVPSRSPLQPRASHGVGGERQSGFMGGVALQNYRLSMKQNGQQQQQQTTSVPSPSTIQKLPESALTRSKPPPPPINTGRPVQPLKSSSFVAPTQIHGSQPASNQRPSGTRLASEPAILGNLNGAGLSPVAEPHKPKKGLPFLKNPMSTLLARRRNPQNAPDVSPTPNATRNSEPVYDPRIKGTRVHDFSAPRPRRIVSTAGDAMGAAPTTAAIASPPVPPVPTTEPQEPRHSTLPRTVIAAEHADHRGVSSPDGDVPPEIPARAASRPTSRHQSEAALQAVAFTEASHEKLHDPVPEVRDQMRRFSLEEKTLSDGPVPEVPPKSKSRVVPEAGACPQPKPSPSIRTFMSRNASAAARSIRDSTLTALPKHMKSTSSRFSFDMIGAAKQEKLLEERHRQRELERQDNESDDKGPRDSRYDDLDDFDYDAMMDDDGLEEPIPGVNADAEDYDDYMYGEEEVPMSGVDDVLDEVDASLDPDDDQENFSGFVFQRSNPTSAITSPTSPGMLVTPRDDSGKVIGFALSKDSGTPGLDSQQLPSPAFLNVPGAPPRAEIAISGLGIVNFLDEASGDEAIAFQDDSHDLQQASNPVLQAQNIRGDELYYDGGFVGDFADELEFSNDNPSGDPFDESIFDLDDTDRFGRPLPGVFAQVQAQRAAEKDAAAVKLESDQTSRMSGQSILSHSTRDSSISTCLPTAPAEHEEIIDSSAAARAGPSGAVDQPPTDAGLKLSPTPSRQDALYQAALAEAANKAAASGKFRRESSSPPALADVLITSPTTGSDAPLSGRSGMDAFVNDYNDEENDPFDQGMDDYDNMDDYDLDEDDIVAEANASALANDSDGFYGQEFGFYSSAPPQHGTHSSNVSSIHAELSRENLYQYSSGGFFGPSGGLERSKSGRIVSREPNLTPITERSEYSNRNSILSFGLPSGTLGSAHPDRSMQSPGLAQLAMLDDGDMSLSSLLRLRTRAFGGSQASLVSSRGEGSPRSERPSDGLVSPWSPPGQAPPLSAGGLPYLGVSHGRKNSVLSAHSRDSDAGSISGSPTMSMNMSLPTVQSPSSLAPPLRSLSSPSRSPIRAVSFSASSSHIAQLLYSPPSLPPGRTSPSVQSPNDYRSGIRVRSPSLDENRVSFRSNSNLGVGYPATPSSPSPLSLNSVFSAGGGKGSALAESRHSELDGSQPNLRQDDEDKTRRDTFGGATRDTDALAGEAV